MNINWTIVRRKAGLIILIVDALILFLAVAPVIGSLIPFLYGYLIGLVSTCIAFAGLAMIFWEKLRELLAAHGEPDHVPGKTAPEGLLAPDGLLPDNPGHEKGA